MTNRSDDSFSEEWDRLKQQFDEPDPPDNWFHPVFRVLVRAASENRVLRRFYPYQAMNQLAFSRSSRYPATDELPAIGAGSTGWYAVMSRPGPDGEVILETEQPIVAVDRVAELLAETD